MTPEEFVEKMIDSPFIGVKEAVRETARYILYSDDPDTYCECLIKVCEVER